MTPVLRFMPAVLTLGTGRAVALGIEIATTTVLMRLLGPEPFGLFAMAASLAVAFGVLGDCGIGASLVSDQSLDDRRVGAAIMLSAAFAVLTLALALAATPLVAGFYGDPRLTAIWLATCPLMALSTVSSVPYALAQRLGRFRLLSAAPIVTATLAAAVALPLAVKTGGVWPILVRQAVAVAAGLLVFWWAVKPRVRRPTSSDLGEIVRFSRGLVTFNLLNVLNRHADNVIVGRALGEGPLGLYTLAYGALTMPLSHLGSVVHTVGYPRLSQLAPNWPAVASELANLMRTVAIFMTPLSLGLAVAAPELILTVFGEAWIEAVPTFRVLALLAIYQVPFSHVGLAYTVSRNTSLMGRWGMLSTPAIVLSFFIGLPWGITGVAIAYACMSLALATPGTILAASALRASAWALARRASSGIAIGAVAALPLVACYVLARALAQPPYVTLAATVAAGLLGEGALAAVFLTRTPSIVRFRFATLQLRVAAPAPLPAPPDGER